MLKNFIKTLHVRLFSWKTPMKMAAGCSLGIILGVLPLSGIRIIAAIIFSVIFDFNILTLLLGFSISMIYPSLYYVIAFLLRRLPGKAVDSADRVSNLGILFTGKVISTAILSAISFPAFKKLYSSKYISCNASSAKTFVFMDQSGKRWWTLKRTLAMFAILVMIVISIFGVSLSINPYLPQLGLRKIQDHQYIKAINEKLSTSSINSIMKKDEKQYSLKSKSEIKTPGFPEGDASDKVYAFYTSWDENSLTSLKQNIGSINFLLPDWYHLNTDLTIGSKIQDSVDLIAKNGSVPEVPVINNYVNDTWDGAAVHNVMTQPNREKFINQLISQVKSKGYAGIDIDFENLSPGDKNLYSSFVQDLSKAFHSNNLQVMIDLPPGSDSFDYPLLCKSADKIIIMMYDEHYKTSEAGPVASYSWFENELKSVDIPSDKLVVALANFGYDWVANSKEPAQELTYSDVISLAEEGGININWDQTTGNPYMRYSDSAGQHVVWFLDGSTAYNEMNLALRTSTHNIALWRLGSEDQSVWSLLKNSANLNGHVSDLKVIPNADPVKYEGQGEILKIVSSGKNGSRDITVDGSGYIGSEVYTSYPTKYEVDRYGKPAGKEIALTFDDGPDPKYTKEILDILDKYNVKGTFFIVGENAEANPDIIRRMYNDGQEIGNHTFTHPNVASITPEIVKLELNSTQRLIQDLTGHSTVLFRPPFVADAEPSAPNELIPILRAQELGYTMVGASIDPSDWEVPPSGTIVSRVMDGLDQGNVILLHDAGGDRSNTVKALPQIIENLKSRGYTFVTVSQMLGKTRDEVMPSVYRSDSRFVRYDGVTFLGIYWLLNLFASMFYLAIVIGIFRLLFLIFYSRKQHASSGKQRADDGFKPSVSMVIAAYNEEKVICKTINSILKSDYTDCEIIVVDDGSKDRTAQVVEETYINYGNVLLFSKPNGGKSSAVNLGFEKAKGEIVIALDADTLIAKDAIKLLVSYFRDDDVAAVSGNVKVGNVHNLLTMWQHVEYVTGFNLERRAFAYLDCVTVVPGAIGAWRKDVVERIGGFKDDTLAEDTDITLTILEEGYKVAFEEKAFAFTEAPSDVKSFLKQRFRWSYGTLQCLWKHRNSLFNKEHRTLGMVALPNMWLFQYVFQFISPVADIYFFIGLFGRDPGRVAAFYLVFLIVDYFAALYAFRLEEENPKPLMLLFLQRFVYRQLMTYVAVKSVVSAIIGANVGWNKLVRRGNVKTQN
jgi:cellulose synthase/poly-beta-1,6-N-acetylglucosamine synthase-like glycosyltransferase/peptidoglycan/xylan/chitin deacetylase (PgdA/CDA1 family)/spore germination protein YaaH